MGQALLASSDHWLGGMRLPLGQRAKMLRNAMGLGEPHLAAGTLLPGAPLGRCCALLPLGGCVCARLLACSYFAARHEVMLQLMCLAAHHRDMWLGHLPAPASLRPLVSDRFLMHYFPRPCEGGPSLLPYAGRPPQAPAGSVLLAEQRRSGPLRADSGAQGPPCLERMNSVLVDVLTKCQGEAILQMERTKLQELKKKENGTKRE